jgi:hypothetical protein
MPLGECGNLTADCRQCRMPQNGGRIGTRNPVPIENFARQIKPPPRGILVEIAKDVGQL